MPKNVKISRASLELPLLPFSAKNTVKLKKFDIIKWERLFMLFRESKNLTSSRLKEFWKTLRFSSLRHVLSRSFPQLKLNDQKGSALVMAAIFMVIATTLITVGMKLVSSASMDAKQRELYVGEAENVARAGLTDALGFFVRRNQSAGFVRAYAKGYLEGQPVSWTTNFAGVAYSYVDQAFDPQNNTVNAQASDTLDSTTGIVNDYPIDNDDPALATYFGHYEVRRVPSLYATVTPQATYDNNAVHDVTGSRTSAGFVNGDGLVWSIVSTGYVYKRMDKTGTFPYWNVSYKTAPNKVVATARLSSEYRKLTFNLPTTIGYDGAYDTGGVYCAATSQVHFSTSNSLLYGAVSQVGTYGVVAMKAQ